MSEDVKITVEIDDAGNRVLIPPCDCNIVLHNTAPKSRVSWNCPHYCGRYVRV